MTSLIKNEAFPYKTGNVCRKRYERLMERQKERGEDKRIEEELYYKYTASRERLWQFLAEEMGVSWDVVEVSIFSIVWYTDNDSCITNQPHIDDDMRITKSYRKSNMIVAADRPASGITISDRTFPEAYLKTQTLSYLDFDYQVGTLD
ncbi:hypothetical protein B0H63DRAFT_456137 [Podospora didyma]|uniref:Uncharacterized protein n=1 Tax=Podospora didyma TaxID=330526 RepID=A0AAE0N0Q9_9PEZI|nr:hypothetical protein B0H63DRAFT_456137 [Podospora didyma]